MKRSIPRLLALVAAAVAAHLSASAARAVQFPTLIAPYSQEIFAGPNIDAGMAWTPANNLLTRNGSTVTEYSLTQNVTHLGTPVHGAITTHNIFGMFNSGVGMTNGLDGYIYAITGGGLQRFDPTNWSAPAQSLAGTAGGTYGITTMPDGRIAYTDSLSASNVYIYDPVAATNTLIYTSTALVDGMVAGPTGLLAVTGQTNSTITILTPTGSVVNSFPTTHYPDGLAFSTSATTSTLYSNNNDGTISRYTFGPAFSGAPTITDIASGAQAYGDLASVGPDCSFYISTFENGSYHGATPGIGTHWDNGTTNAESSIVRIGTAGADGLPTCEFYSPITNNVPEPATFGMLGTALAGLALASLRRKR
jgi:hypothetical protein